VCKRVKKGESHENTMAYFRLYGRWKVTGAVEEVKSGLGFAKIGLSCKGEPQTKKLNNRSWEKNQRGGD